MMYYKQSTDFKPIQSKKFISFELDVRGEPRVTPSCTLRER